LEQAFWNALKEIAAARQTPVNELVRAPQTYLDTAATDERGAVLACSFERSPHPVFE
jgi:predicted DNA-binding ribbon-helix-helix protein